MKYKFLRTGMKSESGSLTRWKKGIWKHENTLDMCHSGLHCSKYPDQAFSFVQGEIVALVETKGKSIVQNDKECWSDMRIVKSYKWTKKDSVALAIYAAQLVLPIFEKEYPKDNRPRKAIEAAIYWMKHPSAWAARAAEAARAAARAAAWAARDAAWAARAAEAARAAARAAAWAARDAVTKKIRLWMIKRIKTLEEV